MEYHYHFFSNGMNRRGITLAELLVGMFVLVIIGTVVYNVYLTVGSFVSSEQSRIEIDLSASRVMTTLDDTLRQAKNVVDSHAFGGTTRTTGTAVLVFTLPSTLVGGVISTDKVDYAALYIQGTDLMYQVDPDAASQRTASTTAVANHVKDVYFRYNSTVTTSISALSMTLATQSTIAGSSYIQYSVLNEVLKNHG